nr:uncharacterized protein LOC115259247 [Aedes albopictus]
MNSARTCGKCNAYGEVNHMIGCDMCDIWLHRECAGLTNEDPDPNKSWRCERCIHDEATEVASNRTQHTTRTSSSIRAQRAELALKLLEEEQELIKKNREKEDALRKKEEEILKKRAEEDAMLLKQKHELLQSLEDGNGSVRSIMSSKSSRRKVESWLGANRATVQTPLAEQPQSAGRSNQSIIPPGTVVVSEAKSSFDAPFEKNSAKDINIPKSTSTPQKTLSTPSVVPMPSAPLCNLPPLSSKWAGLRPGVKFQSSSAFPTILESHLNSIRAIQTTASIGSLGAIPKVTFATKTCDSQLSSVHPTGPPRISTFGFGGSMNQIVSVNPSGSQFVSAPSSECLSSVVATSSQSNPVNVPSSVQWNKSWFTPATAAVPAAPVPSSEAHQPTGAPIGDGSNPALTTMNNSGSSHHIDSSHCTAPPYGQPFDMLLQATPSGAQIAARQVPRNHTEGEC